MNPTRRDFVQNVAVGVAGLSGLRHFEFATAGTTGVAPQAGTTWDVSWTGRLKGKYKAVFDCVEPDSGYGAWRLAAWMGQVADVMKVTPADVSGALIFRHDAIALAMGAAFWQRYSVGRVARVTHPLTGAPAEKNPVLLDEKDGIPAPFSEASVPKLIKSGVVVLACNMALRDMIGLVQSSDGVDETEARKRAIAAMIPGVILQPSGVFAATLAQQSGCSYVRS